MTTITPFPKITTPTKNLIQIKEEKLHYSHRNPPFHTEPNPPHRQTPEASAEAAHEVQELYDLCKETFTGKALYPASMAVQNLCSVLDSVSPADVGLQEDAQDDDRGYGVSGVSRFNRVGRWAQPITFLDIHECDTFTMCIFCFPASSVIPLHDHPEMAVFSKILYGSLHVKAYDWVEPPCVITQDKAVPEQGWRNW